ncbi:tetratricopeptide repeat protein [Paraglaciecola sp. L3A3]|uniref:tetratricopeptide repeat protein n=1 Tax=Paraglaciecola sp. L3A3 TaxID=2686358 RepID=UPI00131C565B|nr:tetratricopeptide repeat protein [Paraglaciecola sp. L3A3]
MEKLSRYLSSTLIFTSLISHSVLALDIFEADRLFEKKQYKQALQEYSKAAQVGSPHAYYQLGTIYHKGLDVSRDNISAYIWLSLAAEYGFSDSKKAASEILELLTDTQKDNAKYILLSLKQKLGKEVIQSKYFPVLNQQNLNEKITFGGDGKLEITYQDTDLMLDSFDSFESDAFYDDVSSFDNPDGEDAFSDAPQEAQTGTIRAPAQFIRKTPFLIVDYDVGPDGSIRNVTPVQKIGYSRTLQEKFMFNTFPAPNFKDTRVSFINRSYMGSATYSQFQMKDEYERLYDKLRRITKKLKISEVPEDKYQYAMMLLTFTWLKQEDSEAIQLLKEVAESGHPLAQFEYGAKLYREQTDIQQGIHWISEASKYGLPKAEYLLASILQNSPWVLNDEKKALYWYESAAQKDHLAAQLKAAELQLLAIDTNLHDLTAANEYLQQLKESQRDNPEYYFLLAIAEKNRPNRDFKQVINYVEEAIDLGEKFNWDVSYWQGLLEKWTTGSVYIVED